ncbi:RnfABCDGE type electron transport complex subunit D [Magnetospira thiophila]
MSGKPAPLGGPFAHGGNTVGRTMGLVMLALLPATGYGLYLFGWPAINLFVVTVLAAVLSEAACLKIAGKPVKRTLMDGSAVLSGWLLALTLPPWAPWWIGVVGAVIALVFAKHVYGGIGQNLFNPAMVARVVLLISFPLEMTRWLAPLPLLSDGAPGFRAGLEITFLGISNTDAVSSASVLGHVKTELMLGHTVSSALETLPDWMDQAVGNAPGSLGETSALLILMGGLMLLALKVIRWHIPLAMIGTLAVLATLTHTLDPARYADASVHVLSGATLLGAFFIATDYVTSPLTVRGQLLFGFGTAVLVFVIRTWAGYPEGVAFAVLLMNACTPLIDRYMKPRVFGRTGKGKPIEYAPARIKERVGG